MEFDWSSESYFWKENLRDAQKKCGTLIYPSSVFNPEDWLLFVESRVFSQKWKKLEMDDETLRKLQVAIMLGPERHPVVPGTGGMRKIRFSDHQTNRGSSSAYGAVTSIFQNTALCFC